MYIIFSSASIYTLDTEKRKEKELIRQSSAFIWEKNFFLLFFLFFYYYFQSHNKASRAYIAITYITGASFGKGKARTPRERERSNSISIRRLNRRAFSSNYGEHIYIEREKKGHKQERKRVWKKLVAVVVVVLIVVLVIGTQNSIIAIPESILPTFFCIETLFVLYFRQERWKR